MDEEIDGMEDLKKFLLAIVFIPVLIWVIWDTYKPAPLPPKEPKPPSTAFTKNIPKLYLTPEWEEYGEEAKIGLTLLRSKEPSCYDVDIKDVKLMGRKELKSGYAFTAICGSKMVWFTEFSYSFSN